MKILPLVDSPLVDSDFVVICLAMPFVAIVFAPLSTIDADASLSADASSTASPSGAVSFFDVVARFCLQIRSGPFV